MAGESDKQLLVRLAVPNRPGRFSLPPYTSWRDRVRREEGESFGFQEKQPRKEEGARESRALNG